jgi:signal transduction histidine kinase
VTPFFVVPLASALACLVFGVLVLARVPGARSHRCMAAILFGAAWWGVCEALWTLAPDAHTALALVRLSAPGWVAVGPLCMHLFLAQSPRVPRGVRLGLAAAYAGAAVALAVEWTTPWMHPSVERVPWGWAYRVGPAYPLWYALAFASSSIGVLAALHELRRSGSPAEARQGPWLGAGVSIPLFVGSVSDGLLPMAGVALPRLGVLSFACLGALVTLAIRRFGYSLMAPGSFAGQILDAMPEGVALTTPDERLRVVNPSLAALVGEPLASLLGRPIAAVLPGLDLPSAGSIHEAEWQVETTAGRLPVALSAVALRDKQQSLIGHVLVVRDLRELVSLRSRLLTSARLAAVGELAAGIAHEINNPLAYIGSNLRFLRERWLELASPPAHDAKEDARERLEEGLALLDESLEGVERAAAIVRDVRAFSRGGGDERERFEPPELVERALRVAAPHLRHRVRVVRELDDAATIEGVRREIEQVLLNLIVNAAQAIEGEGTLRVRTRTLVGEVEIEVADDGVGIPPELVDRIFDPFFTTKPAGEGTGLGLSISHEIVRRHGGRIEVRSAPGRGSAFRVRLPAAPADPG